MVGLAARPAAVLAVGYIASAIGVANCARVLRAVCYGVSISGDNI